MITPSILKNLVCIKKSEKMEELTMTREEIKELIKQEVKYILQKSEKNEHGFFKFSSDKMSHVTETVIFLKDGNKYIYKGTRIESCYNKGSFIISQPYQQYKSFTFPEENILKIEDDFLGYSDKHIEIQETFIPAASHATQSPEQE